MQSNKFCAIIDTIECVELTERNLIQNFYIYCVLPKWEKIMKIVSNESKTVKSAFNDEFENYLRKQQVRTTFNGSEVESFSWYRKALGLA